MLHHRKIIFISAFAVMALLSIFPLLSYTADRIAAKVNSEPIYEEELAYSMPEVSFNATIKVVRKIRLDRLIHRRIIGKLLRKNNIVVTKEEVDQKWAERKEVPPSAGCACCTYPSLENFLENNFYSPEEYRTELANELGYEKYMLAKWNNAYPTDEARKKLLESEKPRLVREFTKVSHIFFNVAQRPEFIESPDETRRQAKAKADAAWRRLQKREAFEKVARDVSEDTQTRANGGVLDCSPLYAYPLGAGFINTLKQLQPGEYSKPVESGLGFHIIRRESINDNDFLNILKEKFVIDNWTKLEKQAVEDAKIERYL